MIMQIFEAFIELDSRFDDRRTMFSMRSLADTRDYDDYLVLENKMIQIVLEALSLVESSNLRIFYKEYFDSASELFDQFSSDGLVTKNIVNKEVFSAREDITQVLRYLCRDLGFITLGEAGKILIIPIERLGFLLCLPNGKDFVRPEVVKADMAQTGEEMIIYGTEQAQLP